MISAAWKTSARPAGSWPLASVFRVGKAGLRAGARFHDDLEAGLHETGTTAGTIATRRSPGKDLSRDSDDHETGSKQRKHLPWRERADGNRFVLPTPRGSNVSSFVSLRVRDGPELDVLFERKVLRSATFQQRPLAALDFRTSLRQFRGNLMRDQADAVLVGVNQVAGIDFDAGDLDRRAEIDQPDVGMADARIQAEELEAEGTNLVEVARAAAGDVADAAELLVDRRGDLAELGPQAGRFVEIPADRDLGAGHSGDVPQVVAQEIASRLARLRRRRSGLRGHGVADDGPQAPAAGSGSDAAGIRGAAAGRRTARSRWKSSACCSASGPLAPRRPVALSSC